VKQKFSISEAAEQWQPEYEIIKSEFDYSYDSHMELFMKLVASFLLFFLLLDDFEKVAHFQLH